MEIKLLDEAEVYSFNEDDLEQAVLEWLGNLGYKIKNGPTIAVDGKSF